MEKSDKAEIKKVNHHCQLSESTDKPESGKNIEKPKIKNKQTNKQTSKTRKKNTRRKVALQKRHRMTHESNTRHMLQ